MVTLPKSQEDHLNLILLQLQQSLKVIESIIVKWKELCCSGQVFARRVACLSDQLKVCLAANLNLMSSKSLHVPDIRDKLRCTVQEALEEELVDLNEILNELTENEKVIKSECYQAEKVYRENSNHLDLGVQNSGTASHPSIIKMVEYIDTLKKFFHDDFLTRKFTLVKLNYDDEISVRDLKEYWTELSLEKMGMNDFQPLVQNFLHESSDPSSSDISPNNLCRTNKSDSMASPLTGNLTGVPRKLRDNCAEWHNQIQRWNHLKINGMDVIQQIVDVKLAEQVTLDQDVTEDNLVEKPSAPHPKLQQLSDIMQEIFEKMVEHVESMKQLTEQFEKAVSLWSFQQSYQQTVSPGAEDSVPFQTWTVETFWRVSKEMSGMYNEEVQVKRFVLENVAHVPGKEELLFLMALWEHDPFLCSKLKLHLEDMLTETRLR